MTRSVRIDSRGHYRVGLRAGTYSVRIAPARFGFDPRTAVVVANRVRVRDFSVDTGIR